MFHPCRHVFAKPYAKHTYHSSSPIHSADAPIVSLSLGAPLDPNNLMKGSDVYLECTIIANPPVKRVDWYHNVSSPTPKTKTCSHSQLCVTDKSATINTAPPFPRAVSDMHVCSCATPEAAHVALAVSGSQEHHVLTHIRSTMTTASVAGDLNARTLE